MKLPKPTRKLLVSGRSIEFTWPQSAPKPLRGHKYPIHNKDGVKAFEIRLEGVSETLGGIQVLAKVDGDPHRPMIGLEGTRNDLGDYESEPERVSAQFESLLAREGRQKTALNGASNRTQLREQKREKELTRAREKGWTKTIKTLERIGRAA